MSEKSTIWRYMSLAKLIDLLSTESLFCCRADLFEDQTEGEWFSHISNASLRLIEQDSQKALKAIKKVNRAIFSIKNPSVDDIQHAFSSLLTPEEIYSLDYSDDVAQVTETGFFDNIDDHLGFLRYMEEKYEEMLDEISFTEEDTLKRKQTISSLKARSYISSWFSGDNHSIAMWKIYGQAEEGIAITTTKEKLNLLAESVRDSNLMSQSKTLCADVIYVDNDTTEIGPIIPRHLSDGAWLEFRDILLKHSAYLYEQEYRLSVIADDKEEKTPPGIKIPLNTNMNEFIDGIYVNPFINKTHWFIKVLESLLQRYGIDCKKIKYGEIQTEYSG
ncbi:MAG: DUF2971 domain-containing protein [Victivallaceae bacterium]|nr:DUF2971 domain-containing protein [Victivallaceae bacterium]